MGAWAGVAGRARWDGNPNLRVEVADVGGGILVALCRVLSEQVRAHTRRDARRHGVAIPGDAADGGGRLRRRRRQRILSGRSTARRGDGEV